MKRYISHLVFALLGCMALPACVDNDYMELDKGHNELVLSTSNTEVALNEQAHGDDALELSWTTGTNYGTGNKISYTLELAKAGSNFAAPYVALVPVAGLPEVDRQRSDRTGAQRRRQIRFSGQHLRLWHSGSLESIPNEQRITNGPLFFVVRLYQIRISL